MSWEAANESCRELVVHKRVDGFMVVVDETQIAVSLSEGRVMIAVRVCNRYHPQLDIALGHDGTSSLAFEHGVYVLRHWLPVPGEAELVQTLRDVVAETHQLRRLVREIDVKPAFEMYLD